ncbi:MAG: hypothetical protein M3Q29_23440 [Chloroflexota bacterium]|nr:hypothetical protein [Chloroflexota bacterium]
MNIAENMVRLQQRLIERRAKPQTVAMLDRYITLAQQMGGNEYTSQLRVLQRLMRAPEAAKDTTIYNDLVGLEEELEGVREQNAREREAFESRPIPKPKKFYKERDRKKR